MTTATAAVRQPRRPARTGTRCAAALAVLAVLVLTFVEPVSAEPAPCSAVQPCLLSAGLAPSFSPHEAHTTPDGDTVVFVHSADNGNVRQLFSVPVRGGAAPVRLDPTNAPPNRHPVTITPDGRRVLYRSDRTQGQALFSVPVGGPASAAVRLSPAVFSSYQVSPDSRLVVHLSATRRLRVTPVDGPESRTAVLAPTAVDNFGISADSRSVVFIAKGSGGEHELFRVPLTANPDPDREPTRLSGPVVEGGGVQSFRLPASDGPVVYSAAQDQAGVRELYSVRLGGGGRVKLNPPLRSGWVVAPANDLLGFAFGYALSSDGRRVVYETRAQSDGLRHELFSVPATGPASASQRIDLDVPDSFPTGFHITADSSRIVYTVTPRNEPDRAFSVPIDGPADARVAVSSPSELGAVIQISPDGARVVSHAQIFNQDALISGPVDEPVLGPGSVRLNGAEDTDGSVSFDPTSRRVVFVGREGNSAESDVYSSSLTQSGSRFNLTTTLTADHIASLTATDQHAVYATRVGDGGYQLYSSPLVPGQINDVAG
jgi:hypothetical protein